MRTDTDHTFLRYKTHEQNRSFQLMIDVEVKEFGAEPDPAQRDIHAFKYQLTMRKAKNMYGARTVITSTLKSIMNRRQVQVRYFGHHLLQFERTNPEDSRWIKWDRSEISAAQLVGLLSLDLDPFNPKRSMYELLRDRHSPKQFPLLPDHA